MTEFSAAMSAVVQGIRPILKSAGFRKRRHTFNRSVETGVVQVIRFQMAQKLPPGAEPVPPIRLDLYGLFTVNFGVAIEEAWALSRGGGQTWPAFANDYDCEIRERLGQIIGRRQDTWWPLDADVDALVAEVGGAIAADGLGWLDERATRASILDLYHRGGLEVLPLPTALPIVMILRKLRATDEAADVLRRYYAGVTHLGHRERVREIAGELDIGGLEPG